MPEPLDSDITLNAVSARLVNGVFGDPGLYLDFRRERRAMLFDLGDIAALPPKKILRLSDVFVSHAHMDHFCGLDRLLRVSLGRATRLRLYGPPGFVERVEHKLAAYTWNLVARYPGDFTLLVHEASPDGRIGMARFRSQDAFGRESLPEQFSPDGLLLDEPGFRVRAAFLDHGIDCLGFAFEEKDHINVLKNRLNDMGLPVGAWLNELKRAVREHLPGDTPIRAWWREHGMVRERLLPLGELRQRVLELSPGRKICYVTDVVFHEQNERRIAHLASGADVLVIECTFLSSEADHAARKFHLTAEQAGHIARTAGAKTVVPFHFSPRYLGREAELGAELEQARHTE